MSISDLKYLVGSYDLSTAGYNSGSARITDRSAFANHWPKVSGTPVFATRGGVACQDITGGQLYERSYLTPVCGSFIAVVRSHLDGVDGGCSWFQAGRYEYGANDHTGASKTSDWNTYRSFALVQSDTGSVVFMKSGTQVEAATTKDTWQVVSGVWTADGIRKSRVNLGTFLTVTDTGDQIVSGEVQRLGYTTAIPTSGNYFSIAELILVRDDIYANQATVANAVIAGLKTQYGIA
jgi:hypothetical protein